MSMSKLNSKFHGVQSSPTECTIHWTAGDCPTEDECRNYLNATGRGQLKPVLVFDPKVVGYPFGKSLMYQKYVKGDGNLNDEIFDMGVTAVYAWYLFDRYKVYCMAEPTPAYDCTFLYTTYDVNSNYQNQSPGFAEKYPEIAAQEEREWEILRDKIEEWLAEAFSEERGGYYRCSSVDTYTGDQREDFWPESIPYPKEIPSSKSLISNKDFGLPDSEEERFLDYTEENKEEREACYKEFLEKELEYERGNPSKC